MENLGLAPDKNETGVLEPALNVFRERFNSSDRVKKLIKGWNRKILVQPTDVESEFTMTVENLAVTSILPKVEPGEDTDLIYLQATEDILRQIFVGDYNPAHAHIDGDLAVFSAERDKIKLEAIALVIWGDY